MKVSIHEPPQMSQVEVAELTSSAAEQHSEANRKEEMMGF
jgi:hypothetical protein